MMNIGTKKVKILHVDDDNLALELTKMYLERMSDDLELVPFTSGTRALDSFKEQRFDCVISDFHMPVIDGLAFLRRVREIDPHIPFMLLSGDDRDDVAVTAMISGVDDYVVKGNHKKHYAEVLTRIYKLLESPSASKNGNVNSNGNGNITKRLVAMLNNLSSVAYIVSEDNHIVYSNKEFAKKYGNSFKKKCHKILFESEEPCQNCLFQQMELKPAPCFSERRNGGGRLMRIFSHPIPSNNGESLVLYLILNSMS